MTQNRLLMNRVSGEFTLKSPNAPYFGKFACQFRKALFSSSYAANCQLLSDLLTGIVSVVFEEDPLFFVNQDAVEIYGWDNKPKTATPLGVPT
jgi:hypothetical protein